MKIINKFFVRSLLAFILVITVATSSYSQTFDLYVKASTIWESSSISVCRENSSSSFTNEMNLVRNSVSNSWESVSAVSFTGWSSCNVNSKGIRIKIDDQGPHVVTLGKELNGVKNGMILNFTFKQWGQSCQSTKDRCK